MPPFVFIDKPSVEDESVRLRKEFATLVDKLDATIKTIPDDRPELMQEKRDWNAQWDALSVSARCSFLRVVLIGRCGENGRGLGDAGGGEEDADGEPEVASATVVTSANVRVRRRSPQKLMSHACRMWFAQKSGARAVVPGAKVDHVLPCGNCKRRDQPCSGSRGQQCDPCKVARTKCEYASFGKASTKKAPSATPVAGGSRLSAPGSIRRTVSSPERQILEVSDSEVGARRRSVVTGKGKKLAVEDDVGDAEDLEELHEMRQVRAQLMQAYSMIFEATLALDKQEQRILKKRAARK
ncbi:hypothetical protein DEU56DRAFT_761052 [Suillus clintonianus]|uniref:uncharacterized protein n=1 Tax=Suillus clintonianus TaxID=1904413 RepID=UPI001B85CB0B|nr:uncharacterized protein DEU56DRAFT_761052 [Suillus clintonianus]KAG2119352.1 hypothetical protein DEU56DRAFT_761052 [Suillus clintonianus]